MPHLVLLLYKPVKDYYLKFNAPNGYGFTSPNIGDEDSDSEFSKPNTRIAQGGANLVNRDEFYLQQLQNYSLKKYKDETIEKLRGNGNSDDRASRGKSKNHLASMAKQ